MLTREQNETLTRVGPGTAMGALMREFWLPALLSSEIPEPDGAPARLRLLGEDLVAYRGTDGVVAIVDAYCPHRRAPLFFGRNEEHGLRCAYHGWKFDGSGRCVDMPSEPDGSRLAEKVRLKAYKAIERNGVVWVYMGSQASPPPPPAFEWARLAPSRTFAIKRHQRCNWAQAVEGGIDSAHVSFLHSASPHQLEKGSGRKLDNDHLVADRHPVFEVEEAPHGLTIAARREANEREYYWRITQFLLPFYSMIPPVGNFRDSRHAMYMGHAWVPIDDYNTWTWSFGVNPGADLSPHEAEYFGGRSGFWGPVDERYDPILNIDNDYRIDRAAQRSQSYSGIAGIPNEDAAMQEGMGPIVDRSQEFLGSSDRGIANFRRLMLRLAERLQKGERPAAAYDAAVYNVRSVSVVLDRTVPFAAGAASLMKGLDFEAREAPVSVG